MLHARVVRENVVAALPVAEETDDTGVGAVEYANNAAFGALGSVASAGPEDSGEDVVTVHGVLNGVAGNKDVAGVLRCGDIGDDEAVAVVVEHEAPGEFVAPGGGGGVQAGAGWIGTIIGRGWSGVFFPF